MGDKANYVDIAGLSFVNSTMGRFVENQLKPCILNKRKCFIVTANPEIVMAAKKNPSYKSIIQKADYVVPDGIGIILAARLKRQPLQERIAGFDLMNELLTIADQSDLSCYFLGTSEAANKAAVEQISESYPNLRVAGRHHGYFDLDDMKVARDVINAEPDIIFTALGYPKQEKWIQQYQPQFSKGLFMGVGGSLDVFAGNMKRAPDFWIKCNMEWLYRLLKQPSRLMRMMPIARFLLLAIFRKI